MANEWNQLRCYWARLLDEMGARQARAAAPAAGLEPPPAFAGIYQKPVRPDEYMCEQMGTSDCWSLLEIAERSGASQ